VLAGKLITDAATGNQQKSLLDSVISGRVIFGVGHDEAGLKGRIEHVATTAARENDGSYVLNGKKVMIIGGELCDRIIISARTSGDTASRDGISLFQIDVSAEGVARETYRTVDQRLAMDVVLSNVRVAADALIGEVGGGITALEAAYDHATVTSCAEAIGAMEQAFWTARDYLTTRKQFGSNLSELQVLRHRLVDMYVELEMARALVNRAASAIDMLDGQERRMMAAATKARVGRAGHFVGTQAVQLHGGIGMTEEFIVGQYLKRLHVLEACFGTALFHTGLRAASLSENPLRGQ
jgi:alkylation response protein AidB-like acyl-CoA dehydrogenase